jgi:uncharacterized protein YegL
MSLPGSEVSGRPVHFIWIADCSGSMAANGKIQALNTAIREAIPEMRKGAASNPHARVMVRAIKFSNGATWIVNATPIDKFQWQDLQAEGVTDMGRALLMVADELKMPPMDPRGLPPVLVLITDGYPTDDVSRGIKAIMDEPWGRKAVRISIGIGEDVDYGMLQRFIGNNEIKALQANNAQELMHYIRWASTAVLQSASAPAVVNPSAFSSNDPGQSSIAIIPAPPPSGSSSPAGDVW